MEYVPYPTIIQIRSNCLISYTDNSYFTKRNNENPTKKGGNIANKTFTESAKKKMKKILDLWIYTKKDIKTNYSFITLTISGKMQKEIKHYEYLKELLIKIKTRYGYYNYVWKAEIQKNGNIHYHIIADIEIDWKLIRRQWNLIQKIYVDEYQNKMKSKYKNGYYFDNEMVDTNNNTIVEEIQENRYKKGYKANWRNPNSTDIKIIKENESISKYINKYINKLETDKEIEEIKLNRWYGCNDELRLIKYAIIAEENTDNEIYRKLTQTNIKTIEENYRIICTIHEKINEPLIQTEEKKQILKNLEIIQKHTKRNDKLIQKEIYTYDKIYN